MVEKLQFDAQAGKITLLEIEESDIEWARIIRNDPSTRVWLGDSSVIDPEQQKEWFTALKKSSSSVRLIARLDGERFGIVRLDHIDPANKLVCVGLDIEKSFRGQGLATKVYDLLLEVIFERLKFNRAYLYVLENNDRAVKLYKKLGFIHEGTARQAVLQDNIYKDYWLMGLLQNEYRNKSL